MEVYAFHPADNSIQKNFIEIPEFTIKCGLLQGCDVFINQLALFLVSLVKLVLSDDL